MVSEVHFLDYYNSLVEDRKDRCRQIVEELLKKKTGMIDIYLDLLQKSMYTLGRQWENNRVSIAEEHAATQITESMMDICYAKMKPAKPCGKKVIISCVDKEFHLIGAKMAAHVFELRGWNTTFLGASTPTRELISFIRAKKPDLVGLSYNFYLNYPRFREMLDHIKRYFPEQEVIAGGQGLKEIKKKLLGDYPGMEIFESIKELDIYLARINRK